MRGRLVDEALMMTGRATAIDARVGIGCGLRTFMA
jgi:hypothetical protein